VGKPRSVQPIRLGSRLVCVCIILTTIWVTENAVTADIARTCAVANDLPKIGVNGSTGVFGLLISKRRLILKLFAAWRVGYQFSEQLNLKRRVPNCGRYRCDSAAPHSKQRNSNGQHALDYHCALAAVRRRRLLGSWSLLVNQPRCLSIRQALRRTHNYILEEAMLKSLYVCATTAAESSARPAGLSFCTLH
jgi:hypothetical protein